MKTTHTTKSHHVGLRLEADSLEILDGLCIAVGGASRSRVLRRLLDFVASFPSDTYQDDDGNPVEENQYRREFLDWFRRLDDAMIDEITNGIINAVRTR